MSRASNNDWHALGSRRIYFGHQSVGQNLVDGMHKLCADMPVSLRWTEGDDPLLFDHPVFAHSRIGVNSDPRSKIDAFAAKMRNGIGNRADLALFKLCYVDVGAATDVVELFRHYAGMMAQLKTDYRQTIFVHITTPLTTAPPRWHRWASRLRTRPIPQDADNRARARFNALMRREYIDPEPLFDLARWEAAGEPDVTRDSPDERFALDRRFTSDGGHLNERGSRFIGAALLDLLSSMAIPAADFTSIGAPVNHDAAHP